MTLQGAPSAEQIAQDLERATHLLRRWPRVSRVWLFGSAAKGDVLDWRSDLDFAVEGLPAEDLARAWAALDEALFLPVDLVRWETARPVLQHEIRQWGRLLYEA